MSNIIYILDMSSSNKYVLYLSAKLLDDGSPKLKIDMDTAQFSVVENPAENIMKKLQLNSVGEKEIQIKDVSGPRTFYGYADLNMDDNGKLNIDMDTAKFSVVPEDDILKGLKMNKVERKQEVIVNQPSPVQEPKQIPKSINYTKSTTINDYRKITWYKNSCYFSVSMWFLWTLIPFREFISKYSGGNDGFLAIKELFNEFHDKKQEPVNIESIYERVVDAFVKRNIGGNEVQFGDQETAAHLIETVLDETMNNDLLDAIRFIFKKITKCSNGELDDEPYDIQYITYSTPTIQDLFDENTQKIEDMERCRVLELPTSDGLQITKLDLLKDTNEYFILQFQEPTPQKYSDIKEINYQGKIFKPKSIISYLGTLTNGSSSGHWVCYVFENNGKAFVLDDYAGKRNYINKSELDNIKINSLVLYKLADTASTMKVGGKSRSKKSMRKNRTRKSKEY